MARGHKGLIANPFILGLLFPGTAVLGGWDAHDFFEESGEVVAVFVAQRFADFPDGFVGDVEQVAGVLDFQVDEVVDRGWAGQSFVFLGEMKLGEFGDVGERVEVELLVDVRLHDGVDLL